MKKSPIGKKQIAALWCVLSCVLFLYSTGIYAEYRSGYFVLMGPSPKDIERDFSELTDSCSDFGGIDTCVVVSADIRFPQSFEMFDSVYTSVGILDLGEFDSTGLQNLDTVPTTGYDEHALFTLHHIYAVKTTEEHYAALFYDFEFIGGISRYGFAWAYQSDGTNNVSPTTDTKMSITINTLYKKHAITVVPSVKGLNISWKPFYGLACFEVYNSSGQKGDVIQVDGRNGCFISTVSISKGIYFIKSNVSSTTLPVVRY